jgi:hypothetical protein
LFNYRNANSSLFISIPFNQNKSKHVKRTESKYNNSTKVTKVEDRNTDSSPNKGETYKLSSPDMDTKETSDVNKHASYRNKSSSLIKSLEKKLISRPGMEALVGRNILLNNETLELEVLLPHNEFEVVKVECLSQDSLADLFSLLLKLLPSYSVGQESDYNNFFFEENSEQRLDSPVILSMDSLISSLKSRKLWLRHNSFKQWRLRDWNISKGILIQQPEKLEKWAEVLMFPYRHEIFLRTSDSSTGESEWSKPFDVVGINSSGVTGVVEMHIKPSPKNNNNKAQVYELAMLSKLGSTNFERTTVTTIAPRFYLSNNLKVKIAVRQVGTSVVKHISPNDQEPLCWTDGSKPRLLEVTIFSSNLKLWHWSSVFSLEKLGKIYYL